MQNSGTLKIISGSKQIEGANEQALIEKIVHGDQNAFASLVKMYEKKIYRICFRFFANEEEALDASQEVFVKVYKAIRKFEGRSSFNTWIYRVATNTCLTLAEKKKKEKEGMLQLVLNWWSDRYQPSPEDEVCSREIEKLNSKVVSEKISVLPEVYRMPVILKDIEGFALDKVADILDVPVGTVKSRLNRGRRILQESLQAYVHGREV